MKVNLFRPYVGQCLSIAWAGAVRVIQVGNELNCFPGGKGVFETTIEEVPGWAKNGFSDPMTKNQLEECEKILNELEETLIVR